MLRGMVKSRRESVELYRQGHRQDLVDKEEAEIAVIESFLPQQMDEAAMAAGGRGGDRRDRRRQHQGHGQGDGGAPGEARRDARHGQGGPDGEGEAVVSGRRSSPGRRGALMALPAAFLDELRARTPLAGGDRPARARWRAPAASGRAAARSTARRPRASMSTRTATTTASAAARMAMRSASSCRARARASWRRWSGSPPKPGWRCRSPRRKRPRRNGSASTSPRAGRGAGQLPSPAVPAGRPPRAGLSARPRPVRRHHPPLRPRLVGRRPRRACRPILAREGITPDQLVDAGLMRRDDETGRAFDLFFNRVMFPIRDRRGRVISFGGRILGDGQPKYVNGPETALFSKRRTLYGAGSGAGGGARRAPRWWWSKATWT